MPRHKQDRVNFDINPKIKSNSIPTQKFTLILMPPLKSSQFRRPNTKVKLILIKTLKSSHFRASHKKQVNSDPYTEINSISIPYIEIKSVSTTHTKTKSSSILTIQPSDFRPACKNQVNFHHPHNNQVNRYPH